MSQGGTNPQVGITAVFDAAEAQRKIDEYEARIQRLEKQIQRTAGINLILNNAIAESEKTKDKVSKKAHDNTMRRLKSWRRDMVAIMFFTRMFMRMLQNMLQNIEETRDVAPTALGARALARSYEVDIGEVVRQLQEVSDGTLSVEQAFEVALAGILADQGQFVDEYSRLWEAARIAAVTAGVDAKDAFEAMVQALAEGSGDVLDSTTNIYQAELALTKYAMAIGTTVDELDHVTKQQVILSTIYSKTNTLIENGADEALAAASATEKLATAWSNLKRVIGVIQNLLLPLEGIATALTFITKAAVTMGAAVSTAMQQVNLAVAATTPPVYTLLNVMIKASGELLRAYVGGDPSEEFTKNIEAIKTAMGLSEDVVDPFAAIYERLGEEPGKLKSLEPIISHILKREDLMQDHLDRMAKINADYDARLERAERTFLQRQERIRRQSARERNRAERDYRQQVDRADKKFYLDREHDLQDHFRKQNQASRKYHLDRIHDEALYQYERGILVAEGDVLAIEDLDARQQLEREKEEDNFRIRQAHSQQDFDAEQRQAREQHELRLAIMEEEFQQRIDEIAVLERERLAEAQERYDEELEMALLAWQQQRDAERDRHAESLRDWAEYWAELAAQTELGASEITDIINTFFGPGSTADSIIATFIARFERMQEIRKQLESVRSSSQREVIRQGRPYGRDYDIDRWGWILEQNRQYGGSGIATRPSMIPVGEGHTPERYSVEPISMLSSRFSIGWSGGAIPITGSGLEGADLSGMGDSIAQGIVVALERSFAGA